MRHFTHGPGARKRRRLMAVLLTTLSLPGGYTAVAVHAAALDAATQIHKEGQQQAAQAQGQIDKLDDATQAMLNEYRNGIRELDSLRSYHQQLEREVRSQDTERTALDKQLADIEVTQREIMPLMLRMLETLKQFVSLDTPFLEGERKRRLEELTQSMDRSDVALGEKYRRLLEAYQIEADYGRTIEAYRGDLPGKEAVRAVDFLRFGRVGLYYLTLDRREVGRWDAQTKTWTLLPVEFRNDIEHGLRIARKQAAPDLLKLPVPAPEAGT